MDTPALDQAEIEAEAEARLPQPSSSKISAVINGMGNGATVGVATYALPKAWSVLRHNKLPTTESVRGPLFATVIGTALGTWYGLHEAKQIENYRDTIGQEIVHLRDRVRVLEGKNPQPHGERVKSAREQEASAEIAR